MPAWSRAPLAVALVAVLLMVGPAMATTTAPSPATASDGSTPATAETAVAFEANTTYQIDMRANGNADWSVVVSFPLENASQREGFDAVASRFEQGEFLSVTSFEEISGRISDTTGRTMRIANVTRRVNTTADRGRLALSFTWTNFGNRQGEQLFVDDVFHTENRLLSGLDEDETLVLTRPDGYQFNSASTNIQNGVLRWNGPHTFGTDEPYVSFTPISPPDTPGNGDAAATGITVWYALGGIVLVGALVAVVYVVRREDGPLFPVESDTEETTSDSDTERASEPAEPTEAGDGTSADEESAGEAGANEESVDETGSDESISDDQSEDAGDEPVDVELLSDEERVERLLEANGGRMKQANIVTETGWSNAKVSQLLSSMDDDGRIEKLRIGRENLISFPDDESDDDFR